MIRVVDLDGFGRRELSGQRRLPFEAVIAEVAAESLFLRGQPEMLEVAHPGGSADGAERMHVAVAEAAPVLEGDGELERGLGGAHEFLLVEIEQAMERLDRGKRRLADTDRADLLGLDQRDVDQRSETAARAPPRSPIRPCRRR